MPSRQRNSNRSQQRNAFERSTSDNTPSTSPRSNNSSKKRRASVNEPSSLEQRQHTGSHFHDIQNLNGDLRHRSSQQGLAAAGERNEQFRRRHTYSSLPPSPIPGSPPILEAEAPSQPTPLFSLWDYLREELSSNEVESHQDMKWERISNFLSIPLAIEKIILFGFILCLDAFLHTFTILPIRFALAIYRLFANLFTSKKTSLAPSHKADIIRSLLVLIPVVVLLPNVDVSKIYHSIRGQDTIKLYVIFNALEIADRLFTSFGEDLMDCLFSSSTLQQFSHHTPLSSHKFRPFAYMLMSIICTALHALMLVYQLTSLNVAINSFDQSLLTLLVSNQFVEIKGSVFKRFEKDNLFQITCADIVERFQLSMMLIVIAFRIMIELSATEFDGLTLPKSFGWFLGGNILMTILFPVLTVLLSEVFVDWLKHAFITKFNHIRPTVYERYTDILCHDLAVGSVWNRSTRKPGFADQAPFVTRRLGLAALPLAVVAVLVCSQALGGSSSSRGYYSEWSFVSAAQWGILCVMTWFCLILIKIMLGIQLVMYATRRREDMAMREAEDTANDYGRHPIGEGLQERARTAQIKQMLNQPTDTTGGKQTSGGKKVHKLEEVTRFTMTKRIW